LIEARSLQPQVWSMSKIAVTSGLLQNAEAL